MIRYLTLLAPCAFVFASLACGGVSDPGLFSGAGASGGARGNAAGASSTAGTPGAAGDSTTDQGGDSSVGGSVGSSGNDSGGTSANAGAEAGGSAGTGDHAGAGGSAAGGSSAGGSTAGTGGSTAGSGGSTAGSGGSVSTEPTCKDLFAKASAQLEAARACNVAKNVTQCTGTVKTTCNCEVPVESEDSAETQAYEATLKQINQRKCSQVCSAIACVQVNHAQCRATGDTLIGSCVSNGNF